MRKSASVFFSAGVRFDSSLLAMFVTFEGTNNSAFALVLRIRKRDGPFAFSTLSSISSAGLDSSITNASANSNEPRTLAPGFTATATRVLRSLSSSLAVSILARESPAATAFNFNGSFFASLPAGLNTLNSLH